MAPPAIVGELVERFDSHADAYRSGEYNEAQLREEFLNPFFDALGWDVYNKKGTRLQPLARVGSRQGGYARPGWPEVGISEARNMLTQRFAAMGASHPARYAKETAGTAGSTQLLWGYLPMNCPSWLKGFCAWLIKWEGALLLVAVLGVVWLIAGLTGTSQFVVDMARALAWPLVVLVLLAYCFRQALNRLINRIKSVEAAGLKADFGPGYKEELAKRIEQATSPEKRATVETLAKLRPATLRLLGTVIGQGHTANLNLSMYTKPHFEMAKQQLRDFELISMEGTVYRPNRKGIEVFSEHVEVLKQELGEKTG